MYFDIHTHRITLNANTESIISLFPGEVEGLSPSLKYSIGIHPLFILAETLKSELNTVREIASKDNVLAIGEIGLDKTGNIPLDIQIEVFQKQIKIAEKLNKPVIIHCVRCFSEIIGLKKNNRVPWIIHGFRGKPELATQLIKKDIFLSFGSAVFNHSPTLYSTIQNTPSDKIFIETDESEKDIKQIYEKIAEIRNISISKLIKNINDNKKKVLFTSN